MLGVNGLNERNGFSALKASHPFSSSLPLPSLTKFYLRLVILCFFMTEYIVKLRSKGFHVTGKNVFIVANCFLADIEIDMKIYMKSEQHYQLTTIRRPEGSNGQRSLLPC